MKSVLGYIRVSTGEQGKRYSLDGQRREIERYCSQRNLQLLQIFEDQKSGSKLFERPGLVDMIDGIKPPIKGIVATESDRLSRDLFQFGWLTTHLSMHGVEIILINECKAESPSEKAFAKIRSVFSEFETELRQARIQRGVQLAKEKGQFMNRPPLGYRMENKRIVIDEKTRPIVQQIFRLARNKISLRAIARITGVSRSTVSFVLHNPFYINKNWNGEHDVFIMN